MKRQRLVFAALAGLAALCLVRFSSPGWGLEPAPRARAAAAAKPIAGGSAAAKPAAASSAATARSQVRPGDWNQWGGSSLRNNTPDAKNIPSQWNVGEIDRKTGQWKKEKAKNVKWVARLGSQTFGNPVAANGQVYVGTNNGMGYLKRYDAKVDLGCLLCFNEKDGSFLWQASSEKLPTGRVHDWPLMGICCAPLVEGERLWYVTSRGEVACLDTQGFRDSENDGPFKSEQYTAPDEADVIWKVDMMKELGISQHNMCSCSVTSLGDLLFVCTSNGVDDAHTTIPAPNAPSFLCMNKQTGQVLWTDKSPGENILHGQWSSPAVGEIGGVPQVVFGGGDGWLYSFKAAATAQGKPELLWKFDCNPKDSKYALRNATRNHIIATPVIQGNLVYVSVGEDPEHEVGDGHLWCVDGTKRGDVSTELVISVKDANRPNPTPIPPRRLQNLIAENGEVARPNPNSAAVWHYTGTDLNGNGSLDFEETMHRTCGTVAVKDGLLFVADFAGVFHCLDAKTGKPHWTYDMLANSWGSPLIVDGKVYIGDEDGDLAVFGLSADKNKAMQPNPDEEGALMPLAENKMGSSVYSTPIVAQGVLYITNNDRLFAIQADGK